MRELYRTSKLEAKVEIFLVLKLLCKSICPLRISIMVEQNPGAAVDSDVANIM